MRSLTSADALRLLLIASMGLPSYACGDDKARANHNGDGDTSGDGDLASDGDGDGDGIGDGDEIGDGDGDSIGDGDGDDVVHLTVCSNPRPLVRGHDTGFYRCEEGYVHRAEVKDCPSVLPREIGFGGGAGQNPLSECFEDEDCEGELSYCEWEWGEILDESYQRCFSSCVSDADCDEGYLCFCGEEFGTCQLGSAGEGGCNTDAACGGGAICAGTYFTGGCGGAWDIEFACTPWESPCEGQDEDTCYWECNKNSQGKLWCDHGHDCGRPFLVNEVERNASSVFRDDWLEQSSLPENGATLAHERVLAAAYYERAALMEHASIAAFARFSLQLLSLGAPAVFIEATNQALIDETKHARLAFSLASRFGGKPVGPGVLEVGDALRDGDPESILTATILEGCVGETLAALEAQAALRCCEDAQVRNVLEQIAEDEGRHAQLAWNVVKWLLAERPALRAVAQRVFERALATDGVSDVPSNGVLRLGVLGGVERAQVRREAMEYVVRPCARDLLRFVKRSTNVSRANRDFLATGA